MEGSMTPLRILFLSTALLICPLVAPVLAVDIMTDGGVLIGNACANIWAAKDQRELDGRTGQILDSYSILFADIADTSFETQDAYGTARMNYSNAYFALLNELQTVALHTGNAALLEDMQQRTAYPDAALLDKQFRAAAAAGATALEKSEITLPTNASANAELVKKLQDAEWEAIRTGKAYFFEQARQAAYEQVLEGIFVCIQDQQNYLKGGLAPDKTTP
jgi:hypothetical protein